MFVAVVNADDQPLMLLPLGIEPRYGARVLTFLDGGVSDYNAPIVFPFAQDWDARTIGTVWQGLQKILLPFDVAIFDKMPGHVGDLPNPFMLFDISVCPYSGHAVSLSGAWEDFSKQRLPRRQDSRRKRRRLGEVGTLHFEVAETSAQFDTFLDALIRQKTRRYIETRGVDGFDRPGYRAFYPEMTRRFGKNGPVHLSALKLDDTIIAAHWGYVVGPRFYYLVPTFEGGDWGRYSAGRLLLEHLLEWSFARELEVFDLTNGDEPYKLEYCDLTIPLYRAVIPVTSLGRVYASAAAVKAQLPKIKGWTPFIRPRA
jgi:CelD/BcsL family acetyltransferase involved in cellulose biosynthesis